jgi:hypothetical protein
MKLAPRGTICPGGLRLGQSVQLAPVFSRKFEPCNQPLTRHPVWCAACSMKAGKVITLRRLR